jgi:hypothetical protein
VSRPLVQVVRYEPSRLLPAGLLRALTLPLVLRRSVLRLWRFTTTVGHDTTPLGVEEWILTNRHVDDSLYRYSL